MKNLIVRFVREEAGQDLIEYAMIATLVSPRRRRHCGDARDQSRRLVHQHGCTA